MTCERFDDLLQEHLDKSLSKAEEAELKAHLAECSSCRLDEMLYGKIVATLAEMKDVDVPSLEITEGVCKAIDKEPARKAKVVAFPTPRRFRWAWGVVGLAAVVLMALGLHLADTPNPNPVIVAGKAELKQLEPAPKPKVLPRPIGRLIIVGQEAKVLRNGTESWQTVKGEIELALGDRVQTAENCDGILYYEGRGRLTVKPNTDLQIINRGIRIRSGSTWIKIAKRGKGFYAETPNAVAAVRGTIYTVEVAQGEKFVERQASIVDYLETADPNRGMLSLAYKVDGKDVQGNVAYSKSPDLPVNTVQAVNVFTASGKKLTFPVWTPAERPDEVHLFKAISTQVNVFRGAVEVYPGTIERPLGDGVVLKKNEAVDVCGNVTAKKAPIQLAAYRKYGMEAPPEILTATVQPVVPTDAVDTATTVDANVGVTVDNNTGVNGSVQLLNNEGTSSSGPASSAAARPGR